MKLASLWTGQGWSLRATRRERAQQFLAGTLPVRDQATRVETYLLTQLRTSSSLKERCGKATRKACLKAYEVAPRWSHE